VINLTSLAWNLYGAGVALEEMAEIFGSPCMF
jgi:hypothetical protein